MPRIYADFERMSQARKAIEALNETGIKGAHLDMIERYADEHSREISIAGSATGPSLAGLVLKSKSPLYDVGKAALLASDPMVSGYGSFGEIADSNTRSVLNVEADREEEARKLLSEMGGWI